MADNKTDRFAGIDTNQLVANQKARKNASISKQAVTNEAGRMQRQKAKEPWKPDFQPGGTTTLQRAEGNPIPPKQHLSKSAEEEAVGPREYFGTPGVDKPKTK